MEPLPNEPPKTSWTGPVLAVGAVAVLLLAGLAMAQNATLPDAGNVTGSVGDVTGGSAPAAPAAGPAADDCPLHHAQAGKAASGAAQSAPAGGA